MYECARTVMQRDSQLLQKQINEMKTKLERMAAENKVRELNQYVYVFVRLLLRMRCIFFLYLCLL